MRTTPALLLLTAYVCGVLTAHAVRAESSPGKIIKIGYVTDFTGAGAFVGEQTRRGAVLAQRELAAAGQNVQIVFGDSSSKPAAALSEAARMVHAEAVDAFICDLTPACSAISNFVKENKRPLIYLSPVISIANSNPYAYRNFLDYQFGCSQLAAYFKEHGVGNFASVKANTEFGELCLEGARRIFPQHTILPFTPGDDLRTIALSLRTKHVEALIQVGYESDLIDRFRRSHELGHQVQSGIVEIMLSEHLKQQLGSLLEGTLLLGYQELSQDFIAKLEHEVPSKSSSVPQTAAFAYLAVRELVRALQGCPSQDVSCATQHLQRPPQVSLMGFKGWTDGQSPYTTVLKIWHNGKAELVH